MSKYYNFSCFGLKYLTNANIKHYVGLMQQKYTVGNIPSKTLSKLKFFNNFQNDYTLSSYFGLTDKLGEKREQVKFRIGNHKLRIETGRYDLNSEGYQTLPYLSILSNSRRT